MRLKAVYLLIVTYFFLNNSIHAQSPGQLKEVLSSSTSHFANNLEFSKDGNYMVLVVGFNADVYQKKENGFQLVQTIRGGTWQAYNPGISYDGTFICFSNYEDTYVYKRTGESYSLFQTIKHPGKSVNKDLIMRFDENDKLMIIGGEGNIRYYELSGTSFYESKRINNKENLVFQNAALSPNGKVLATIDVNGDVHCWQLTADNAIKGNVLLKTNKYTGMLDVSDDQLLVAGETDSLNIYQVSKDLNSISKFFQFPEGKFGEVNFNPDGNRVMVSDKSSQLYLYTIINNIVSRESVNRLDKDNFTSFKTSADGKWLAASSSGAKTLKIFEAPERLAIAKKSPVKSKTTNKPVAKVTKPVTPAKVPVQSKTNVTTAIAYLKKNGKYILVDSVSLKPISTTEYDQVGDYSEGLASVTNNQKYGFIDKKGKEVITLKYDYVQSFENGMANVQLKNKWGFIDKSDKEIIPIKFETGMVFKEGMAKITLHNLIGFINSKGEEIIPPTYAEGRMFSEGLVLVSGPGQSKRIFFDNTGKGVISFNPGHGISDFKGGMATVFKDIGQSWLIDKTGKDLLNKKYTEIRLSENGVAILNIKPTYNETTIAGKYGMVSNTGKEILPLEYDYIGTFGDEIFLVAKGNNFWCINKSGVKLFDFTYQNRQDFKEGKAAISKNGKWGYINKSGKEIIPPKYDNISGTFSEGLANVRLDGKWGFIDGTGKVVIPFKYSNAYGGFKNGMARIKEKEGYNEPWFYISKKGIEYREK